MKTSLKSNKPYLIPDTKRNLMNQHAMTFMQYIAANISRIWDCPRKERIKDTINISDKVPDTLEITAAAQDPSSTDWCIIDEEEWGQFEFLD